MQTEKLLKIISELQSKKHDEYGPYKKAMQDIADVWSVLVGKSIRPWQVALMYAAAKIVRANHKYKQDSYQDAISYLIIADETHKEDVSDISTER